MTRDNGFKLKVI